MSLSYVEENIGTWHRLKFPNRHSSFMTQANKTCTKERHTEWHSLRCHPRWTAFLQPYGVGAAVGTRDRYICKAVPHPRRSKGFPLIQSRNYIAAERSNRPQCFSFSVEVITWSTSTYDVGLRVPPTVSRATHVTWRGAKRGRREENENEDDVSAADVQVYEAHARKSFL